MKNEINNLSELKLAALYSKTDDITYMNVIDNRIQKFYQDNIDPLTLNNEQLVLLIQKYNMDIHWDALYNKTKKCIHYCIHKYASKFHKQEYMMSEDREQTDLYATLREGWFKSVRSYNIVKGSKGFVPFASTVMMQSYTRLALRHNDKHVGSSVNSIGLEDAKTFCNHTSSFDVEHKSIQEQLEDESSEYTTYESVKYIQDKMEQLKEYDNVIYEIIKLRFFEQLTQPEIIERISDTQGRRSKEWVARRIKKGNEFLRARIPEEMYRDILKDFNN